VLLSLSVLLFARAFYIVRADKKLRARLANMTREERSIYNNQKLAELAAIKAYTDREKTARTLYLAHSSYRIVYPGDVDYDVLVQAKSLNQIHLKNQSGSAQLLNIHQIDYYVKLLFYAKSAKLRRWFYT
ncbi:MAG: hypothetical protein K2X94_00815, partial [Amoebophilaceae bacterium]|nr:hypothetical protein [Amoebophilaceae bacterium]